MTEPTPRASPFSRSMLRSFRFGRVGGLARSVVGSQRGVVTDSAKVAGVAESSAKSKVENANIYSSIIENSTLDSAPVPRHPKPADNLRTLASSSIAPRMGQISIVDEMVAKFTHTSIIDYLRPGIPPTGRFDRGNHGKSPCLPN